MLCVGEGHRGKHISNTQNNLAAVSRGEKTIPSLKSNILGDMADLIPTWFLLNSRNRFSP
jgi:hypothetical protein